jgi:hypothetical protein
MAGAITPNRAILLISMTAVSIACWRQSPACPHRKTQIELAYLGGAAARMAAKETAFGDRSAFFIMNLLAHWSDPSADTVNTSWIRGLFNTLRPAMKPGGYVNFMSGDEQHRAQEAYQERWDRMVAVKTHYDPNRFFRLNQECSTKETRHDSTCIARRKPERLR